MVLQQSFFFDLALFILNIFHLIHFWFDHYFNFYVYVAGWHLYGYWYFAGPNTVKWWHYIEYLRVMKKEETWFNFFLYRFFKKSPRCPLTRWPKMLLEMSECSGELLLSRHAVCPPIRYYSEASLFYVCLNFIKEKMKFIYIVGKEASL